MKLWLKKRLANTKPEIGKVLTSSRDRTAGAGGWWMGMGMGRKMRLESMEFLVAHCKELSIYSSYSR